MYNLSMLTKEYIQSIVENENLVVRNLQVTQGYYRLSKGMKRGASGKNVSWCSFATHASKTAGQALRHELMPGFLKSAMIRMAGYDNTFLFLNEGLIDHDQDLSGEHNSHLGEALRRVSLLISDGNITVFKELAWSFANFINTFKRDYVYDTGKLQAFLDENFQPGPLSEGGQDTLSGSGAENWADLSDRMSFVVDFFRSHQQYKRLWEMPFLEEQASVIESGHFPAGPL